MVCDKHLVVFAVPSRNVLVLRQDVNHIDESLPQFFRPRIQLLLILVEVFPDAEYQLVQLTRLAVDGLDRLLIRVCIVSLDPLDLAQLTIEYTFAGLELGIHATHGHLPYHHRRDDNQPAQDPEMLLLEYRKCNLDLVHRITPRATEVATNRMSC